MTRYYKDVIELGAFNHLDDLEALKKGLIINRL